MQLETPLATVVTAAKWAHAKGVPVILNPAPAAKLPKELNRERGQSPTKTSNFKARFVENIKTVPEVY